MNCTIIQRRLLGAEDPAHPSDEVQTHLEGCPCCREWQHLLLQLEQQVPLLPVPASDSRAEFLQRLLHTPVAGTVNGTGPPLKIRVPELVRQRVPPPGPRPWSAAVRHWMPLAGVAASLLLIVLGWRELVVQRPQPTGPDPLVARLMGHHLQLVKTLPPEGRTQVLAALLGDLERETQSLRRTTGSRDVVQTLESLQGMVQSSLRGATPPNSLAAGPSTPPPATAERMLQLRQNQLVLRQVVTSCVQLADKDDALERAAGCKELVRQLVREISQAADQDRADRAVEMSGHLCAVLEQGVADNLSSYRQQWPQGGSVVQRNVTEAGTWAVDESKDLEAQLARSQNADVQVALQSIRKGRSTVAAALSAGSA